LPYFSFSPETVKNWMNKLNQFFGSVNSQAGGCLTKTRETVSRIKGEIGDIGALPIGAIDPTEIS
jgi:hypothetical protein